MGSCLGSVAGIVFVGEEAGVVVGDFTIVSHVIDLLQPSFRLLMMENDNAK